MQRHSHSISLALLGCAGIAGATDPRFGELPPGAVSTSETHDVTAEICRDHLFDPKRLSLTLPTGYRLTTAAEAAKRDPVLESIIRKLPELRDYAMGSLCFVSAGRLEVDGTPVLDFQPTPLAFWWAAAEGPRHTAMRGKTTWVQLKSWYPSAVTRKTKVLATDPMAEFTDIQVEQVQSNRWRVRLALPGETITAEVTTSGRTTPSRAEQPGFMSVPMSGRAADYFSVFTYFGHHHQAARGDWRSVGTGVFTEALSIEGEAAAFGTIFQAGWRSRSGLYTFSSK
jgi:hypothetical protein